MKQVLFIILLTISLFTITLGQDLQVIEKTVVSEIKKTKSDIQIDALTLKDLLQKIDDDAENVLKEFQEQILQLKEKVKQDIVDEVKILQAQQKQATSNSSSNDKFMDFSASPSIGDIIKAGVKVVDGADLSHMISHVSHSFNVDIHHFIEIDSNNRHVTNNYYINRRPPAKAPVKRRAPVRRRAPERRKK